MAGHGAAVQTRRWRRGLGLLVVAILLAGCSGSAPDSLDAASETDSGAATGQPPVPNDGGPTRSNATSDIQLDFVDCVLFPYAFLVESETVDPALPAGYEPNELAAGLVQVNFNVLWCASAVLNQVVVMDDVEFAVSAIRVSVNSSLAGDAELQFYVVEAFANQPPLAAWLATHLTVGRTAVFEWGEEEGPIEMALSVDGSVWYDFSATPGIGEAPPMPGTRRDHHVGGDGASLWLETNYTFTSSAYPGVAVVEAHQGLLAELAPEETGRLAGIMGQGPYRGSATIGELES